MRSAQSPKPQSPKSSQFHDRSTKKPFDFTQPFQSPIKFDQSSHSPGRFMHGLDSPKFSPQSPARYSQSIFKSDNTDSDFLDSPHSFGKSTKIHPESIFMMDDDSDSSDGEFLN